MWFEIDVNRYYRQNPFMRHPDRFSSRSDELCWMPCPSSIARCGWMSVPDRSRYFRFFVNASADAKIEKHC